MAVVPCGTLQSVHLFRTGMRDPAESCSGRDALPKQDVADRWGWAGILGRPRVHTSAGRIRVGFLWPPRPVHICARRCGALMHI